MSEIAPILTFRFHTGSIKSHSVLKQFMIKGCFDSILVRLKDVQSLSTAGAVPKFRFHTGSIKSKSDNPTEKLSTMFRFHTGSIKRWGYLCHTPRAFFQFRFHTGSIKSLTNNTLQSVSQTFRFHTGSIKRPTTPPVRQ